MWLIKEATKLEGALQVVFRHALTTIRATLDTGINMGEILAKVNAKLDCHACRVRETSRCERAKRRVVTNAIEHQKVDTLIEHTVGGTHV